MSYSHDSPQHVDQILALSDRLRNEGIDCSIDQYIDSPPEGWPTWMCHQVEAADHVIVVCTPTYEQRFSKRDLTTKGRGATWESSIITQELYDDWSESGKFIPVVLRPEDKHSIPTVLRSVTYYDLSEDTGYSSMYRRLTKQPRSPQPLLGSVISLPELPRSKSFVLDSTEHNLDPDKADTRLSIDVDPAQAEAIGLDIERAMTLLANSVTGLQPSAQEAEEYQHLRRALLGDPRLRPLLPDCLVSCRRLADFWGYIRKLSLPTYASRREYLREQFHSLLLALDEKAYTIELVELPDGIAEEDSDDEQCRDVYARFGLAFYHANVLEHELINLCVLTQIVGKTSFTPEWVESLVDSRYRLLFGQLVREVRALSTFPEDVAQELQTALAMRNQLAHSFFRNHSCDLTLAEGRARMIAELTDASELFQRVDERLTRVSSSLRRRCGISDAQLEQAQAAMIADAQAKLAFEG